jgi:hypothetical protein
MLSGVGSVQKKRSGPMGHWTGHLALLLWALCTWLPALPSALETSVYDEQGLLEALQDNSIDSILVHKDLKLTPGVWTGNDGTSRRCRRPPLDTYWLAWSAQSYQPTALNAEIVTFLCCACDCTVGKPPLPVHKPSRQSVALQVLVMLSS